MMSTIPVIDMQEPAGAQTMLTILAVDDAATMRETLRSLLSAEYDLLLADSAAAFAAAIDSTIPNIVLLDLNLPDGNGIDLCRSLRRNPHFDDCSIIIITAYSDEKTLEEGYLAGADDFLRKPFIPTELLSKIRLFDRSIRDRQRQKLSLEMQIRTNEKLNWMNRLMKECIGSRDIRSSLKSAEGLADIIETGYLEVAQMTGGEFSSVVTLVHDRSARYKTVGELASRGAFREMPGEFPRRMRIKSGGDDIHCLYSSLQLENGRHGIVLFEHFKPFTDDDMHLVSLFTSFFGMLYQRFSIERVIDGMNKSYRSELSKVRKIQVSFLPDFSKIRGYDISSTYLPAEDISGDFFDGYYLNDHIFQITICDVSGHGVASSYVGNQLRTLFKNLSAPGKNPSLIAKEASGVMTTELKDMYYFATAIICQIDLDSGNMVYVNAGHPPMILNSAESGTCSILEYTGPIIGLFPDNTYHDAELTLESGDSLLMYTDGLTEAADRKSSLFTMFGEERLLEAFKRAQGQPSRDILHSIVGSMYEFTQYCEQMDDITAICIRRYWDEIVL
jgi:serine phosphatase RsbU (regulator of sigma subunit)/DNA-binding response OmpR family regulator